MTLSGNRAGALLAGMALRLGAGQARCIARSAETAYILQTLALVTPGVV
jgi:hypothetical protein